VQTQTRYTRSGDVAIAYQVIGDGPFDVVFVPGSSSHVELNWEVPALRRLNERLARFCRLIVFDKRGTGMSDRVQGAPPLEVRMDDVRAVMDAAGSERAEAIALAEKVALKSAYTVRLGKAAFYRQLELPLSDAYRYAAEVMTENMMARDAEEGICAFIEKRDPKWEDR